VAARSASSRWAIFRNWVPINVTASITLAFFIAASCALYYLIPLGRFREGLREMEKMLEQDPLSTLFRSVFSLFLGVAGEYERALVEARKSLESTRTCG
jgi:hypothetical protein